MSKDYFCIFAGGGVRGTAYIGVLKVLEELGIKITGLAGSSIGAVFSALYAAGYTYEEMREITFKSNYESFRDINFTFAKDFGICKGDGITCWLKEVIEKKYYGENYNPRGNKPVTFKDINKDLIIIAANITKTGFKEYSRIKTPDTEIAQAVRASISIPWYFKPVWDNGDCLVDGDIVNYFPLWSFASELLTNTNSRILEFRLQGSDNTREIKGPLGYFGAILDTTYNISTNFLEKEYGDNDQFDIIRIDTGKVQVMDFGVTQKEKEQLIIDGENSARKYFKYNLVKKKRNIVDIYEKLKNYLNVLKIDIEKNNTRDFLINFGNIALCLAENKENIHKNISNQIMELKKLYQDNIFSIKFFNIKILRNKKDILLKVKRILENLKENIQDMNGYIDEVSRLDDK